MQHRAYYRYTNNVARLTIAPATPCSRHVRYEYRRREPPVSIDVLPDDILEQILSILPVDSICRGASVCKRWQRIVQSTRFVRNLYLGPPQTPWYYLFTCFKTLAGHAFDPVFRRWHGIELPCIDSPDWVTASSGGLVLFVDNNDTNKLYVCNPITGQWRRIVDPPSLQRLDYRAFAISYSRKSSSSQGSYTIAIVDSEHNPENILECNTSIRLYDSETMAWRTPLKEVLTGYTAGNESVICDGRLYALVSSVGDRDYMEHRHGVIRYDLSGRSPVHDPLKRSCIPAPCLLTCGRLMNLGERLVMVGGIRKPGHLPGHIGGIGIWVLHGGEKWEEIARMPARLFHRFGEFDEAFASRGAHDLIYIHSYWVPTLLIFDMSARQWRWSRCPAAAKRSHLHLYTGFCFEPRLEVAP